MQGNGNRLDTARKGHAHIQHPTKAQVLACASAAKGRETGLNFTKLMVKLRFSMQNKLSALRIGRIRSEAPQAEGLPN